MLYKQIAKKNLFNLFLGTVILSIGINLFIAPHNLAFGGITGMTIIVQSLMGVPLFISNFILSIAVIVIGWLELGREFMIKTMIPTVILPFFLYLTEPLSGIAPCLEISAIMGAVTIGIGVSLTMHAGGSTAGPDTIGLVLKKRFSVPVTVTMLAVDISVILCGYHIYGTKIAVWSITVAVLMNLTVKATRDILSKKLVFRYCMKHMRNKVSVLKN